MARKRIEAPAGDTAGEMFAGRKPETPRESLERKMSSDKTQELTAAEKAELDKIVAQAQKPPVPQPIEPLKIDASELAIALKAKGHKIPVSQVLAWSDVERLSAKVYADGKLLEIPHCVRRYGEEGILQRSPLENDFGAMAERLKILKIDVTLDSIAKMNPADRFAIAEWLERKTDKVPDVLTSAQSRTQSRTADLFEGKPETRPATPSAIRTKTVDSPAGPVPIATVDREDIPVNVHVPDVVEATWGEEKFCPIPGSYATCTVGPFEMRREVKQGESRSEALVALNAELAEVAKAERRRKLESFVADLKKIVRAASGKELSS